MLPLEWSETKNINWKVKMSGAGWSSPVLVEGKLFLTGAEVKDGAPMKLAAYCFEAGTGKPVWRKELFTVKGKAPRIHQKNSHATPTPTVEDGRLYVHFGTSGTACLDLAGKVR